MSSVAPVVYLTCELKGRDLGARLLIADHVVAAGYTAVVGQFWGLTDAIMSQHLPPGVMCFATANKVQVRTMAACKRVGQIIATTDEEALPLAGKWMLMNLQPDV